MFSAVLGLAIGVVSWLLAVPVFLPVIGLAFGANAAYKHLRSWRSLRFLLGTAGLLVCVLRVGLTLAATYLA